MDLGGVGIVVIESVWGELLDTSGNLNGSLSALVQGDDLEISDKVEGLHNGEMSLAASCYFSSTCSHLSVVYPCLYIKYYALATW